MINKILISAAISLVVTLVVAVVMVFSVRPKEFTGSEGLDFTKQMGAGLPPETPNSSVTTRSGRDMPVRDYASAVDDAPLVILIHGSGWHGMQFHGLAQALQGQARVLVPDLRGHGATPERRGDVDYIGQLEDDIADLINAERAPRQKVVLVGHSSGGGLVVRFAGGTHGGLMDGAVLLAPFLKHNAPTTRTASGGWTHVMLRRVIGLSILNTFRIRALNHLPIIQFNMPSVVLDGPLGHTATTQYSYRLNTSFAPRGDYLADVAKLPPFLLLVGQADEAFDAAQYEPVMQPVTDKGRYEILPDVTHLEVVFAPQTADLIGGFLNEF